MRQRLALVDRPLPGCWRPEEPGPQEEASLKTGAILSGGLAFGGAAGDGDSAGALWFARLCCLMAE